jgi:hypothetical protein
VKPFDCDRPSPNDLAIKIHAIMAGNPRGWTLGELILRSQLPQDQTEAGLGVLIGYKWVYLEGDRYWLSLK